MGKVFLCVKSGNRKQAYRIGYFTREQRSAAESTSDFVVLSLLVLVVGESLAKMARLLAGNGLHLQPCLLSERPSEFPNGENGRVHV